MPLVESVRTPSLPTALRPLARSALIDCSDNLIFVSDVVVLRTTNTHLIKIIQMLQLLLGHKLLAMMIVMLNNGDQCLGQWSTGHAPLHPVLTPIKLEPGWWWGPIKLIPSNRLNQM